MARKFGNRGLNQMSSVEFRRRVREPGLHTDGGGLYLRVGADGRHASWIAVYHLAGKRREIGLGSSDTVGLARAREKAAEVREMVDRNIDPIEARRAARAIPTFGKVADDWIDAQTPTVKSDKSVARWRRAVGAGGYAEALRSKRVDAVSSEDVLAVLRPIWHAKATTARTVRIYVESVLDAAKARKLRTGDNPAAWGGNLEPLLGASKRSNKNHDAVPWRTMPQLWSDLRQRSAVSAKALQFTILTSARTSETTGLKKKEIDRERRVWAVPAERMKAGMEHEVPLSTAALALLDQMGFDDLGDDDLVFPGGKPGEPLSNMAMLNLLQKRMKRAETVHGFRSAFRDWAGSATAYPRELAEEALAHAIGDATERAYRRESALDRRRPMMEDWSKFLARAEDVRVEPASALARARRSPLRAGEANNLQTSLFTPAAG